MTSKEKLKKLTRNEYREIALGSSESKQKWTVERTKRAVLVAVLSSLLIIIALKVNSSFMGDTSSIKPLGLLSLFIFPAITGIIAGWWMDTKDDDEVTEVDYDGRPIAPGMSKMLSQDDKEKYLEVSSPDRPRGLVFCEDRKTGKLLGLPEIAREFGSRLYNLNLFLLGCSGSGKTNILRLLLMQAIDMGLSIFALDPKIELTANRRAQLEYRGYKNIWSMFFYADDIDKSDGVDLLKFVRTAKRPLAKARKVSTMLLNIIKDTSGNPYWPKSVTHLLTCVTVYVACCENFIPANGFTSNEKTATSKDRTLLEVVRILRLGADKIYALITQSIKGNAHDEKLMRMAGLDLWKTGDHDKQVLNSLYMHLGVLQDEEVLNAFSRDVIDFEKAITEKSYLAASFSTLDEDYKHVLSLFIDFYIDEIERLARKTDGEIPLRNLMLLEELKIAGRIPVLSNAMAIVRGYGTAIVACTQYIEQMVETYGENETYSMLGNSSLIYTGGSNDSKTLEELSKLSGCQFVEEGSESSSVGSRGAMYAEQVRRVEKPVISYSTLVNKADDEIYVKLCNCNATIEKSFSADRHPSAGIIYVNKFTGERRNLSPLEIIAGTSPEELGLEISFEDDFDSSPRKTKSISSFSDFL